MILKGNQRGGSTQLARHLLNTVDNDHVQVHTIDGFIASDVHGAFNEMNAISKGTKARQFMFSLSLSPPAEANIPVTVYENAIDRAAEKLGLAGQPRIVIFHEKATLTGVPRRHCHVVFSRIDADRMRAITMPFYKERLRGLSRELFLEQGWSLPRGLADKSLADPLNFGLTEWQEAKRARRDPREIKSVLMACWAQSDNSSSFKAALESKGFWLCRGDRRGFVALDYRGNAFSLSRWTNVRGKELQARLGAPEVHQSVNEAQVEIASRVSASAKRVLTEIEQKHANDLRPLLEQKERIRQRQRDERQELALRQAEQRATEARCYAHRLRRGLRGVWDWITGRRHRLIQESRAEMARLELQLANDRETYLKRQRLELGRLHSKVSQLRRGQDRERNRAWLSLGAITEVAREPVAGHGPITHCVLGNTPDFEQEIR